jgi:hypothetical protein
VSYPILHRVYLQKCDDPEAEFFITTTLIISSNSLYVLRSETSQKKNYSKNFEMPKFRMIPEPDLTQAISPKV